ncbi:Phospholipase D [Trema orientale]|uniref:Phospholipase D n=1 Tax=Trema orientale TaxID=63057 RepID=A0A2P5FEA2_TREOI|nr:Phospholipase D [Trema orientale]
MITLFPIWDFVPQCVFANGKGAYVTIKINDKKVAKTTSERDRVWNQSFQILCAHPSSSTITITLKTSCSILGKFQIQAHQVLDESSLINGFFPLSLENGKQPNQELKLRFLLWFKPAEYEPTWEKVLSGGEFQGLKNASFPQRSNTHVTLYQDAHHCSTFQPPFDLCGTPRRLWEDVYKAIEGAKYLVYIAGWSFNPKMVLVRDSQIEIPHAKGVQIGELLKRKAEEGVGVRIMLWDDETSLPLIKNKGIMRTHDEDALAYFKHSKVVCKLCPRLHNEFPTFFSHHQKTITVDTKSDATSTDREIMSFIGGLDLCDGRYDTEQHSLFRTLNAESHCFDFYQTNIAGASLHKGGPREPWHDSHACLTGEAAWDILTNFEQRWTKQLDPSLLVPTSTLTKLINQTYSNSNTSSDHQTRNWKVQVFRSIDHVSATQLFRNLTVEQSIHEAYVDAIRKADKFIYIENQYFIGGCHLWEKDKHCGCRNLIPVEIALKVVNKIKAKERFAAYVLIPMWPEGVPESESVQDILYWTRETMTMMYKLIGEAIEESGGSGHPRDYLNFFCLANRETERNGEYVPPYSPHPDSHYWNAQKHRRFMVYVHSKLMIVDDAYIIIGSANINQRSMDGQRDTEIAIGCYQHDPQTTDIRAFRTSLWYEHTWGGGSNDDVLQLEPQSLECVGRMRSIGDQTWSVYSADQVVDMGGVHLVSYPVTVTENGRVEDLEDGGGRFPDTNTHVRGKRSKVLPPIFTT